VRMLEGPPPPRRRRTLPASARRGAYLAVTGLGLRLPHAD
jgi:hypothetical protein